MIKISNELVEIANNYNDEVLAEQLQVIANQYQDIQLSEELESIAEELDNVEQGSYHDFVKAVQKPTRQNVMKYEKSIAPKAVKK